MKKLSYLVVTACFVLLLAACGGNEESEGAKGNQEGNKQEQQDSQGNKQDQQKQAKEIQKKMEEQQVDEDKTVAIVNKEEIKGSKYNSLLSQNQMQYHQMGQDPTSEKIAGQLKKQVLDTLVGQELLLQEANSKGYEASSDKVEKQINDLKEQYGGEDAFNKALEKNNLTKEDLKQQISQSLMIETYVDKEIKTDDVSEKEMKEYYEQIKAQSSSQSNQQEIPPYEEVKEKIKQQLESEQQQEKLQTKVDELKKDADIEIKI
ncbi:SurA N-terminal domain-containing protein [Pseudalkalibacillus caeni]|uniref:peptidylprolyl isomerase n=1 Tax=Exobacillus caeni TaxID=2574798 RepID=A0A5R9FH80_9BACL|nr:SurA N-terminal domain-containing protein [Pseudalkalibacillus caeni]TLS38915.1 peptidylprolyl isomerase [Pseudalkalibacillus caeni]